MRPLLVRFLIEHGAPGWLAPDYGTMVGLATLLGAIAILRMAKRDRANVRGEALALIVTYIACLAGGYVFEWVRMIPAAIAARSLSPILFAGRAAYGGLLGGLVAATLFLRWKKIAARPFLDRATLGMGLEFAFVRTGCFLEGCDYGKPTASVLGVRFPSGSLAAEDHLLRGFVPPGSPSLPVHPTELYEALLGLVASALAWQRLRTGKRDGGAFVIWIATYAIGRFLLELLRGDDERGHLLALSSAQIVSLGLLAMCVYLAHTWQPFSRRFVRSANVAAGLAFVAASLTSLPARAAEAPTHEVHLKTGETIQGRVLDLRPNEYVVLMTTTGEPKRFEWSTVSSVNVIASTAPPPPAASASASASAPASPPPAPPPPPTGPIQRDTIVGFKLFVGPSVPLARTDVPVGVLAGIDGRYRMKLGDAMRLEVGIEYRVVDNDEARRDSLGVPAAFVFELGRWFEVEALYGIDFNWFSWKSQYFSQNTTSAWSMHGQVGASFAFAKYVAVGAAPLAIDVVASTNIGVITSYQLPIWLTISF